ncbi:MAG: hypothetical protein ACNA8R_04300 [Nitriliruptoraceae bacterium]
MLRLSRLVVVTLSAGVFALSVVSVALADVLAGSEDDAFIIEGSRPGSGSGNAGSGAGDVAPTPAGGGEQEPPPPGSYEPIWGTRVDTGEPCIDLVYRSDVAPNSPLAIEWDLRTIDMTNDPRVAGATDPMCQPVPIPVVTSPAAAADDFVRRIPLPEPQLRIDPGFALTGLPAYLVINDQSTFTVDENLAGWGMMRVELRPTRFVIDWGDGTIETIVDGRTGAAHDGDASQQIAHVYRWSDSDVRVSVRSAWQAAWQVGGFSGVVDGLVIDATLALPVREYRAVRTDR